MDEYQLARNSMIKRLREHYHINDERVLAVMGKVPRHLFVPEALKFQAYRDNALPIASKQTISQPFIVAKMTELLEINNQAKILEIGAGSGYQTVILSQIAGTVYSIERIKALADEALTRLKALGIENVSLQCKDGTKGLKAYAPFDGILVAAGGPSIPEPLLMQLKDGGKLVIPIGSEPKTQKLVRITRKGERFLTEDFGNCSFVPLIGEHGWK
ncbi:MAG: protein-L-isoaspartate(D-aspartate) O-methyltransferase [Pyrinomonadaceae bacterium]